VICSRGRGLKTREEVTDKRGCNRAEIELREHFTIGAAVGVLAAVRERESLAASLK